MMRALISGIAGQDGSYLAEHLLAIGYEVHGIVRRQSVAEHQDARLDHLAGKIFTYYGDLTDAASLERIVREVMPDEVYNLAAQSHVRVSFDVPLFTTQVNALGAMSMIDVCRRIVPDCRYYQASSSEMFGASVENNGYQRESTPMYPTSPYGLAKLHAYGTVRHYRKAYGMYATNGILFNHSSPRRGSNFVEAKICKGAAMIARGLADKLVLGNLDAHRDWGHSQDYVRAMHLLLTQPTPGDWVVATGKAHTVRELCHYVFGRLDMDYQKFVVQDPKFLRPEELPYLRGDATRVRALGWAPSYTFESLLDEILEYWMARIPSKASRVTA